MRPGGTRQYNTSQREHLRWRFYRNNGARESEGAPDLGPESKYEQHGEQLGRVFIIRNTRASLDAFCGRLDQLAKARDLKPIVRLEATGVYSWPLTSALAGRFETQIFHPTQLKSAKEDGIRKSKNDTVDARTLATTSKQAPRTDYSDTTRLQIRELGRYREKLEELKEAQWKRLMRNVFVKFPGLDDQFTIQSLWMRAFLKEYATPEEVVQSGEDEIARLIAKANGMEGYAKKTAKEVIEFCQSCLTTSFVGDVLGLVNRQILARIEQLERDIEEVEAEIQKLWETAAMRFVYPQLAGMDATTAAVIYGELGDVTRFTTEDAMVASCGLDPVSWQSGAGKARVGRISKQGPPVIRKVLGRKAMGMKFTNPIVKAYWEKKAAEGKPFKSVRTASAKRLARLVWMTEHKAQRETKNPEPT
ncbi:MAG: IS110 family RNA-guided transposase [Thermoplasmatota archaeon]